ncbi:MAG: immunoglobulin domain-containing protein, partial [Verrucomicrobiota bacterium]
MKKLLKNQWITLSLLLAAAPLTATAAGNAFSFIDNFNSGSTVNSGVAVDPSTITSTSTSYQTYNGLAGGFWSMSANDLMFGTTNTSSMLIEVLALFTNTPVPLTAPGDYIALQVVFVNTSNILSSIAGGEAGNASLNIGLFDSGGVPPNLGNMTTSAGSATDGTQNWLGYFGRIFYNSKPDCQARSAQTANGSTSQNQDLLFSGASATQSFNSPNGTVLGSADPTRAVTLTNGQTYTLLFTIAYNSPGVLNVSNALFAGTGTGGGVILALTNRLATNATYVTGGFDGFAIGWRSASSSSQYSTMDISSIQISGISTPVTSPPLITTEPLSATVGTNGSCAFFVTTVGFGQHYQWYRNGIQMVNGGNISGATKSMLVISPAGDSDQATSVNGYSVIITGTGGYTTNSVTNSLALVAATNLIYNGDGGPTWDLNTTTSWQTAGNANDLAFNFGDSVTFNDVGFGSGGLTLTGPYLSAASCTVAGHFTYVFASTSAGSFAGPGGLLYTGTGGLEIDNANTYTGGTVISNNTGTFKVGNLKALGTGPVTNALAGDFMEITVAGSASSSMPNDFVIATNLTIQFDATGTYAGDFSGNFYGNPGAKLTFTAPDANSPTNERVRFYGTNTTYNGNLVLSNSLIILAPYEGSGFTQTYNGVISGLGAIIQRGSGTTILNGTNTYSGGTSPTDGAIGFGIDSYPTVGTVITNGPIGTNALLLTPEVGELTGNGQVFAYGGARTIGNLIRYPSGTNNLTLIIGGTNDLTFSGACNLAGLDGLGTNNIRTLQVTNIGVTTFSGVISDTTNGNSSGCGLSITGTSTNISGPLVLSNTETYTGPTTITNHTTLRVNGSLNAASAVTVNSNATLAGTGTINGPVTVNAGGTLSPGASIGTITLSGGLTLKGNLFFEINTSVSPSNDYAVVTGTLT